jgi:hypothetical protein
MKKTYLVVGLLIVVFALVFSIGFRLTGNVVKDDSCDYLSTYIMDNQDVNCTDPTYQAFGDIDKDGIITFADLILVDNENGNTDWCFAQLDNNANPCIVSCPVGQTKCSDGVCRADCGGGGGNGGGGGGGGMGTGAGNTPRTCTPDWGCSWQECANGIQKQRCTDFNACNSNLNKPVEATRACGIQESECLPGQEECSDGVCRADCSIIIDDVDNNSKLPAIIVMLVSGIILLILIISIIVIRRKQAVSI